MSLEQKRRFQLVPKLAHFNFQLNLSANFVDIIRGKIINGTILALGPKTNVLEGGRLF